MTLRTFAACALLLVTLPAGAQQPEYDLLIRNARIVDGTGNPWYRGSVGIRQGSIAAIGQLPGVRASRILDAEERFLAPGFIDVHTHVEGGRGRGGIEAVPGGENFLMDGVTTIVTGNCGGSVTDVAGWFEKLAALGLGLNVATLVGHNSVRSEVVGSANRQATADEIRRMQEIVDRAMRDGAVGFSTGLLYVPGAYADTSEVVELARAASKHGGIYASHIRNQADGLLDSITEAAVVGREARMPVQISHFKVHGRRFWGRSDMSIALVESFRREGIDVAVDQYPYDRASTGLTITVPSWALADGSERVRERLRDPETRAGIVTDMKKILERDGFPDYSYAMVASFPEDRSLEGKTIPEIAASDGLEPGLDNEIDTILGLMERGGAQMIYRTMAMEDVERILRYPHTAIASDGGVQQAGVGKPHPRSYGTNARVLSEYVRERAVLTLEDAVRRMTSLPALRFGFRKRGMVREGFAADLVLFDLARVRDRADYGSPHRFSEGFDLVLVNGGIVVEDGKLTDARPGQVLRRSAQPDP